MRVACLESIRFYPVLAAGAVPETPEVSATLWMSQYDPEEVGFTQGLLEFNIEFYWGFIGDKMEVNLGLNGVKLELNQCHIGV